MTAQDPEILIFEGERLYMPTLIDLNGTADCGFPSHTANNRGYVGIWEIVDSKLYLNEVENGRMKEKGSLFADWVSQELHVWKGNLLRYMHAGWGSIYEEDMFLSIDNGILKCAVIENNVEKFKAKALQEVRDAPKDNIRYLYEQYLDPRGPLSRLIEKSTTRKQEYADLQKDLEFDIKQRLLILAEDPANGIKLQYK